MEMCIRVSEKWVYTILTENYVVISIQKYRNYFQLLGINSSVTWIDIKVLVSVLHVVFIYLDFINK